MRSFNIKRKQKVIGKEEEEAEHLRLLGKWVGTIGYVSEHWKVTQIQNILKKSFSNTTKPVPEMLKKYFSFGLQIRVCEGEAVR